MEQIISSYDHTLIYYPNFFFPIFFLFCCIAIFFIIKAIIRIHSYLILLLGEISNAVKRRIKKNLKLTKMHTRKSPYRKYLVVFSNYALTYLQIFVKTTNNIARLFSRKTNSIVEKIKKEVLING